MDDFEKLNREYTGKLKRNEQDSMSKLQEQQHFTLKNLETEQQANTKMKDIITQQQQQVNSLNKQLKQFAGQNLEMKKAKV